jgi:ribose/xylose/arabinose/galactoside ABC-type transport system permease subunit
MSELGKMLIGLGALLVVLGIVLLAAGRLHLPLGRLPGDITWRGKSSVVYFPVVTCIVLSVLLSLLFWIIGHFRR